MKNILVAFLLLFLSSCVYGQIQKKEIGLQGITEIEIGSFAKVFFVQSQQKSLVMEYDNILSDLIQEQRNNSKLSISIKLSRSLEWPKDKKIYKAKSRIYVYGDFNDLRTLSISGAHLVKTDLTSNNLSLKASGCGIIRGKIDADILNMEVQGCILEIGGSVNNSNIVSNGSVVDLSNIDLNNVTVSSNGSKLIINAKNRLNLTSLEGTYLKYGKNPEVLLGTRVNLKSSSIVHN